MSYLEKLLDGAEVEWMTLGEIGVFTRGKGLQKKDFTETGVGCIHYGQIYTSYGMFACTTKTFVSKEFARKSAKARFGDLIIATTSENDVDVCKAVVWLGNSEIVVSNDACFFTHSLNPKYVAYFFRSEEFQIQKKRFITGTKVRRVNPKDLMKILIPVPPLSVQHKIVEILDNFTEFTAELTAELTARRQQYEYYRNQLLTFDEGNVEWKKLVDVTLSTRNVRWKNNNNTYKYIDLSSVDRENKSIIETNFITAQNAPSRAQKLVLKDDVIYATTRPTLNRFYLVDDEYSGEIVSTAFCVLRADKETVLPKWIYYNLFTSKFNSYLEENQKGSAYPAISDAKIKEYKIPIPPIEEQERIVSILDKFDALTTSLTEGLPREIELRQKQYEYYREMLLSFPKPE